MTEQNNIPDDAELQADYNPEVRKGWLDLYAVEPRVKTHIDFATNYSENFDHGTDGHLSLKTIDLLASIIDSLYEANEGLLVENNHYRHPAPTEMVDPAAREGHSPIEKDEP